MAGIPASRDINKIAAVAVVLPVDVCRADAARAQEDVAHFLQLTHEAFVNVTDVLITADGKSSVEDTSLHAAEAEKQSK